MKEQLKALSITLAYFHVIAWRRVQIDESIHRQSFK